MESLPAEVFQHIFKNLRNCDLEALIKTSKSLRELVYNDSDYVVLLDENESANYASDPVFRHKLDRLYTRKNKVFISVHLCWTTITDVSALGKVHTLELFGTLVSDVSALGNVHKLGLRKTNVTDVSALGKVHTLDLSYTKVTDVSALGNVHTLDLSYTNVTDISALKNVKVKLESDGESSEEFDRELEEEF